jgi:drug/metabolite transporter (DMT)-like permease
MTNKSPGTLMGVTTVVLTLIGWASVPLFLRHFADSIDLWTSNGWRYGFSALVWLPVIVGWSALRPRAGKGMRRIWIAAIVPSIVNAAGQVCFTAAHYYIEPGLLTFGLRTQLVFVAIGAWMLFPAERAIIRRSGYLIGACLLIIGMTGVILLEEPDEEVPSAEFRVPSSQKEVSSGEFEVLSRSDDTSSHHSELRTGNSELRTRSSKLLGVSLALLSGMLFAAYGLAVRKYMHGVNSVLAFATICQYTAAAMVILMFMFGDNWGSDPLSFSGMEMVKLLGSALIGIAIGHVFYYFSIARLGVAVTAGVLQLQPFLVAIGSFALFNEILSGPQWVGGIIAVGGAMLMLSVQWRASKTKQTSDKPLEIAEGQSES